LCCFSRVARELPDRRRLARPLQTHEHDARRALLRELDARVDRPHELDELVVAQLDEVILGRRTRRSFSFDEARTLTMTPVALSRTRWQKSCTTSKPTSASSSDVRTSLSASSTVASSSSARPWNRCFALRKPFVSVSNIGAESSP